MMFPLMMIAAVVLIMLFGEIRNNDEPARRAVGERRANRKQSPHE